MSRLSRRDFLTLVARGLLWLSGLLGLAGLLRFLSYEPDPPPPKRFEVGPVTNFLINTRTVIKDIPAVIIRDQVGNFSALSLVCQHLGCTVETHVDGFVCPCHGSRYATDGSLLQGPAQRGLQSLKVEVTSDGQVIVTKA